MFRISPSKILTHNDNSFNISWFFKYILVSTNNRYKIDCDDGLPFIRNLIINNENVCMEDFCGNKLNFELFIIPRKEICVPLISFILGFLYMRYSS